MSTVTQTISNRGRTILTSNIREAQPAPILQLPIDVLYDISDFLPLHVKATFAQTCSDVRNALKNDTARTIKTAAKQERLSYLQIRERALPNYRLCYMCMKLHKLDAKLDD